MGLLQDRLNKIKAEKEQAKAGGAVSEANQKELQSGKVQALPIPPTPSVVEQPAETIKPNLTLAERLAGLNKPKAKKVELEVVPSVAVPEPIAKYNTPPEPKHTVFSDFLEDVYNMGWADDREGLNGFYYSEIMADNPEIEALLANSNDDTVEVIANMRAELANLKVENARLKGEVNDRLSKLEAML